MTGYQACPLCGNPSIQKVLTAKDFSVSGELFEIWQCENCTGRFTQNIPDKETISRYYLSDNYISHSDASKGLVNRLYLAVRKHTLSSKRKLVERHTGLKKGSLLDMGCGTGAFLNEMNVGGWEISGIEPDSGARHKASELYGLRIDTPDRLTQYAEYSFDAITLWHVLEHVHELHHLITRLKKLVRNTGMIFIAVPNYTAYDAQLYREYWAAYDVPRHLYHFSPTAMKRFLDEHDLVLHKIKPMWFDSFYIGMLSEKYKTGRTNLVRASWRGLVSNFNALQQNERCSSLVYIVRKKD